MYTPTEAATVFRYVRKMLTNNPELFTKEGVFRISGDHEKAKTLIREILDPRAVMQIQPIMQGLSVFDAISALKLVLDNQVNPQNNRLAQLKSILEKEDLKHCVQAVHGFIHELCTSVNIDEHCTGEVLYTFMQLAKETVKRKETNRMNAENLGIVLGPNFEKIVNNDPMKMLLLTNKLNVICKMMLEDDTYSMSFEEKYAQVIIQAREKQIIECQAMKRVLEKQTVYYQEKISEYQGKVAREKVLLNNAHRKDKKSLLTQVNEDEIVVASYRIIAEEAPITIEKLNAQINQLQAESLELKQKNPDQQIQQWQRIAALLEEIDEYITDPDDEPTRKFTLRKSFDGVIPMDVSDDVDENGDKDSLRKSRNPLMTRM